MSVNPLKTKLITYSRSTTVIVAEYSMDGSRVERCEVIRDLGVLIDSSFEFGSHISHICSRASRSLGLIIRTVKHGLSTGAAALMFRTLARPLLEYCSVVWSPYQHGHIKQLQSVQRRFVRFLGCRSGMRYFDVSMDELSAAYGLRSLECRRRVAVISFLYRLINCQIDCFSLLEMIRFRIPTGTRQQHFFELSHAARNHLRYSPIPRLMRLGNDICSSVNFFSTSLRAIKCIAADSSPDLH
ncbi:uncharacterized protein LOC124355903 [Homalodisca vitripennis]|uniref:uncharacterized protein LOC124355903 n=1 Tax=Homalodisca vitripennis TaxID=197043 RepID=UPI001EE9C4E0|nr:uncharacterized protein LOC124355903 [Homalodisca vitripennis]